MKITFIFILILFIDSVNRVYRVQVELADANKANNGFVPCLPPLELQLTQSPSAAVMGHERMEVQARKFYSQRNMYLCGFTLFLSLILNRTYIMILDVLRLEEKVKRLEGDPKASGKDATKLANAGGAGEIGRLKEELAARERDIEALKSQSSGLAKEYDRLNNMSGPMDSATKKRS